MTYCARYNISAAPHDRYRDLLATDALRRAGLSLEPGAEPTSCEAFAAKHTYQQYINKKS